MPAQPSVQTVNGATQFNGTANQGLVDFDTLAGYRTLVYSVSYYEPGTTATDLLVYCAATGAPATQRIILISAIVTEGFALVSFGQNGFVVPQQSNVSWNVFCETNGKTQTASLIVDWAQPEGGVF